jgi:hypothetical protein
MPCRSPVEDAGEEGMVEGYPYVYFSLFGDGDHRYGAVDRTVRAAEARLGVRAVEGHRDVPGVFAFEGQHLADGVDAFR